MAKVRVASFDDCENILALMKRNDMAFKNRSPEELQHLWKNNPAFENRKGSWPIGWVLENDTGEIVGFFGNIPVGYDFKGRRLTAACGSSWAVDAAYRGYSILLLNSYFNQKSADLILNTSADYKAGRLFQALKARRVPIDWCDTVFFWISDYREFVSGLLIKKRLPFASFISLPLSLALWGVTKLKESGRRIGGSSCAIRSLPDFDERFDIFWENLRKGHNGFLCVRDKRTLDWHFKYAIIHKKVWIFVAEKKSQITAYAAFLRQDNPETGLRRIRLVDFQTIDDDFTVLRGIISCGIKECRKEDIHLLEVIGFDSQKRAAIESLAPFRRKLPSWPFFYKAKDETLARELENPEVWDPCFFDGDASL